jgi:hypothetical protein
VQHPQLGAVEVGGFDPRVGIWNPPTEELDATCRGMSAFFLRVATLLPKLSLTVTEQVREAGHTRIVVRVANHGYLGSAGIPSAQSLPHAEPLRLTTTPGDGVTLLAPTEAVLDLGHLEGWGSGLYGSTSAFSPWTRGNGHERFVTLLVAGSGTLVVEVASCRVGAQRLALTVG